MSRQTQKSNPVAANQDAENGALLGRRLSYAIVRFHEAVGTELGLTLLDHKHLDLIERHAPLTAGELGKLTSLTSGAVTALVDRLERAGYVQRRADSADRRKVVIDVQSASLERLGLLMQPLTKRMATLTEQFTPKELSVVSRYLTGMADALDEASTELRENRLARRKGNKRSTR